MTLSQQRAGAWTAPLLLALVACRSDSIGPASAVAVTPADYKEHRTLFVRPSDANKDQTELRFSYEAFDEDLVVKNQEPLSIVVGPVYLPKDTNRSRDILVILDLQTTNAKGVVSIAVWYQQNHEPGTVLGFDKLLVYSDRSWNAQNQPWFKLRVMDVSSERNAETVKLLRSFGRSVANVAEFIPHPAAPGVALGIRLAEAVSANRRNKTLIDYTSQFFSKGYFDESGPASDLAVLMRGSWVVVARPKGEGSDFWKRPIGIDRRSMEIIALEAARAGQTEAAPYVGVTISTYRSIVPTVVMDRSAKLFELLLQKDGSGLESTFQDVASAVTSYRVHAELVRRPSTETLGKLMAVLTKRATNGLNSSDVDFLVATVGRMRGEPFQSVDAAVRWWVEHGKNGIVDGDSFEWRSGA